MCRISILAVLLCMSALPLFAQTETETLDPSVPTAVAIAPPSAFDRRVVAMLAWMASLKAQEFPVTLEHSDPFEPRIFIRGVLANMSDFPSETGQAPSEIKKIVQYDLFLYGPSDRVIIDTQLHTGRNVGEYGLSDTSTWTASFRYTPRPDQVAPETISTYTFEFNKIRSDDFVFGDYGLRKPDYKNALRPAGAPACASTQREQYFTEAPPFRLDICVHDSARTSPKSFGSTGYSFVAHYDKALRWKRLIRKEAPKDTTKPASRDNPLVPIEVYEVHFTDPEGKDVKYDFDPRALWSWNEGVTLYLSQHGIRELRWVGDLDAPIPPKEPITPAPAQAK